MREQMRLHMTPNVTLRVRFGGVCLPIPLSGRRRPELNWDQVQFRLEHMVVFHDQWDRRLYTRDG